MIPLFISYSHQDETYFKELRSRLDDLRPNIDVWHDGFITAGDKWDQVIKSNLKTAEIVVFVLSEDFLLSKYIKKVEIASVLKKEQCKIVSVIVRPVPMDDSNVLSMYQSLPPKARPISEYENPEIAWLEIKSGIQQVILNIQRAKLEVLKKGSSNVVGINLQSARRFSSFTRLFTVLVAVLGIVGMFYNYNRELDLQANTFNILLPLIIILIAVFSYLFLERQKNLKPDIWVNFS